MKETVAQRMYALASGYFDRELDEAREKWKESLPAIETYALAGRFCAVFNADAFGLQKQEVAEEFASAARADGFDSTVQLDGNNRVTLVRVSWGRK